MEGGIDWTRLNNQQSFGRKSHSVALTSVRLRVSAIRYSISDEKPHSSNVCWTAHTHGNTRKTYFSDLILTSGSVPWEVEEVFGAGDGDHLSDVGAGPAGDLVPRPTATCSRAEKQNQRDKHHKRTTQNNFFFNLFLFFKSVNVWLKLLWGDKEQAALSPGVPMAANVKAQVSWVNSSGMTWVNTLPPWLIKQPPVCHLNSKYHCDSFGLRTQNQVKSTAAHL